MLAFLSPTPLRLLGLFLLSALILWTASATTPRRPGVLPGEFEHHDGLLICWDDDLTDQEYDCLLNVIEAAHRHSQILALTPDEKTQQRALGKLADRSLPLSAVKFVRAPCDSPWARDIGPLVLRLPSGGYEVLDVATGSFKSDHTAPAFALQLDLPTRKAPMHAEGGNLLSNGAGLIITTKTLFKFNRAIGVEDDKLRACLKTYLGANEVVVLEPLFAEDSGHVDMFAAFTSADTIVVSQPENKDSRNAKILDRNAEILSRVQTPNGPLRVERIPMPKRTDRHWRTYTNVAFVNGRLLFPTYDDVDPAVEAQAVATYRRLLPKWEIVKVDATAIMKLGGALHCATMNIAHIPEG